ncbi:MAG: amidohydrolase family protein [Desulfobacterota bacterium]|nr:amidohydrolase family protein [Thermodesulfobacteriota bacterium]
MIIDGHTHIFPESVRRDRIGFCGKDRGFAAIYAHPKARLIGAEELIASMDEAGVSRAVICGFPWRDKELCALHNAYLIESSRRYPGRLIVFILFPFSDPEWSLQELERGIGEGACGVGEMAFYDRPMSLEGMKALERVFRRMEQWEIPLLLHANEPVGHLYPGKVQTDLETIYQFVLAFPGLKILLAHWGGGLFFYELMPEVARAMKNVFYDTAASPFLYSREIYQVAKRIIGVEKIVFGSDFPLIRPGRYFEEMERLGLTTEEREKILGSNLLRLLPSKPFLREADEKPKVQPV